jgi:hypothetical protein
VRERERERERDIVEVTFERMDAKRNKKKENDRE